MASDGIFATVAGSGLPGLSLEAFVGMVGRRSLGIVNRWFAVQTLALFVFLC